MQTPVSKPFRSAFAVLCEDSGDWVERAMQLLALDRHLRQSLPEALAAHVKLGNLRGDRLVFLADSPAWKARLRFHTGTLLRAAQAAGIPARSISVNVVATMQPAIPDPAPPPSLSPSARQTLRAAAAATQDEELRARLLHLASLA